MGVSLSERKRTRSGERCGHLLAEDRTHRIPGTFVRHLPWWKDLGDDHQTVEAEAAPATARTFDDKHPELPPPPREEIACLLERTCPLLHVQPHQLIGTSTAQPVVHARRRFACLATLHFRHPVKAVAQILSKSPHQVSRWLTTEIALCSDDPTEQSTIEDMACKLLKNNG